MQFPYAEEITRFSGYRGVLHIRGGQRIRLPFSKRCPLSELAFEWFFLHNGDEAPDPNGDARPGWGGDIFRYRSVGAARAFHFGMAEYFIKEYYIDGFRLDEFKGIDNYESVQDFTGHAHVVQEIPMFLAGEEFADLHDTDRRNWRHKMSDAVDWSIAAERGAVLRVQRA